MRARSSFCESCFPLLFLFLVTRRQFSLFHEKRNGNIFFFLGNDLNTALKIVLYNIDVTAMYSVTKCKQSSFIGQQLHIQTVVSNNAFWGWAGVAEWYTVPCLLCAAWTVVGLRPKSPQMLADTSAGMWIKKAQLHCWSLHSQQVLQPEVNLRITQVRKHAKGLHSGFESKGRCHQKSKTGVSVAPQTGLMSSKKF